MKVSLVWLGLAVMVSCGRKAPPAEAPLTIPEEPPSVSASPAASAEAEATDDEPTPLTPDECRSQAGEVLTDKGDGSLRRHGCPSGRPRLGSVRVGIEGGLCCGITPVAATPSPSQQPSGKRAPCHTDQQCNQDESVSALWGKCTPLGVCECNPGFELNPMGRCQKHVE